MLCPRILRLSPARPDTPDRDYDIATATSRRKVGFQWLVRLISRGNCSPSWSDTFSPLSRGSPLSISRALLLVNAITVQRMCAAVSTPEQLKSSFIASSASDAQENPSSRNTAVETKRYARETRAVEESTSVCNSKSVAYIFLHASRLPSAPSRCNHLQFPILRLSPFRAPSRTLHTRPTHVQR